MNIGFSGMSGIFQMNFGQLEGVAGQFQQQGNSLENEITNPLKGIVQQVSGGIWKGDGANRFVEEMTTQIVPMLASLFIANSSWVMGLKKSIDTMTQATQQATKQAETLVDLFNGMF